MLAFQTVATLFSIAVAKPYGPGLADLIQIVGGGGAALGAFIGILLPAPLGDPDRMWKNAGVGVTIGSVLGTFIAFALWAAIRLNGGVG